MIMTTHHLSTIHSKEATQKLPASFSHTQLSSFFSFRLAWNCSDLGNAKQLKCELTSFPSHSLWHRASSSWIVTASIIFHREGHWLGDLIKGKHGSSSRHQHMSCISCVMTCGRLLGLACLIPSPHESLSGRVYNAFDAEAEPVSPFPGNVQVGPTSYQSERQQTHETTPPNWVPEPVPTQHKKSMCKLICQRLDFKCRVESIQLKNSRFTRIFLVKGGCLRD